jgi:hypothetical protein
MEAQLDVRLTVLKFLIYLLLAQNLELVVIFNRFTLLFCTYM